jgi:hypothetical protein
MPGDILSDLAGVLPYQFVYLIPGVRQTSIGGKRESQGGKRIPPAYQIADLTARCLVRNMLGTEIQTQASAKDDQHDLPGSETQDREAPSSQTKKYTTCYYQKTEDGSAQGSRRGGPIIYESIVNVVHIECCYSQCHDAESEKNERKDFCHMVRKKPSFFEKGEISGRG